MGVGFLVKAGIIVEQFVFSEAVVRYGSESGGIGRRAGFRFQYRKV